MSLFWSNHLPAKSLENESRGIPEFRLHHVAIIATWHALALSKWIELYLGRGWYQNTCLMAHWIFILGVIEREKEWGGQRLLCPENTLTPTGLTWHTLMLILPPINHIYIQLLFVLPPVFRWQMYVQAGLCSLATFFPVNELLHSCNVKEVVRVNGGLHIQHFGG